MTWMWIQKLAPNVKKDKLVLGKKEAGDFEDIEQLPIWLKFSPIISITNWVTKTSIDADPKKAHDVEETQHWGSTKHDKLTWTIRIHNCRDFGVRVHSNKLRSEVIILEDVDDMSIIFQSHLLQCYPNLLTPTNKPDGGKKISAIISCLIKHHMLFLQRRITYWDDEQV